MEDYAGLIFLALPILLLWTAFTRARRQQRQLAQVQAALRPGQWAMTTSGLHGQVIEASEGAPTVLLEVAPGVRTRWARQAIAESHDQDPVTRAASAGVEKSGDASPVTAGGTSPEWGSASEQGKAPDRGNATDDRDDRTLS